MQTPEDVQAMLKLASLGWGAKRISREHANLVSFTCLKALAFDQRFERKDAHDLIYSLNTRLMAWTLLPRLSTRKAVVRMAP